jgi:hypothetical protein
LRQIYFEELAKELLKDLKAGGIQPLPKSLTKKTISISSRLAFLFEKESPISIKTLSEYTDRILLNSGNAWQRKSLKITDVKRLTSNPYQESEDVREMMNKMSTKPFMYVQRRSNGDPDVVIPTEC